MIKIYAWFEKEKILSWRSLAISVITLQTLKVQGGESAPKSQFKLIKHL